MLPMAGQTTKPIGLTFFVDTQGWAMAGGGEFLDFFFTATPGPSARLK